VVRDRALAGEFDAAHMLSPMPIALSLGLDTASHPWTIPAIENINGQAIVLATAHKDRRDPKTWKGMRFAIPFETSMHNYLLRYYLAEAGLDPDRDVTLRVTPPPEMVANLRAGNIDGFLGPDPMNQRAVYDGVGFIHLLSKQIWDGHPCCAFAVSRRFIAEAPNTFMALTRALVDATLYANKPENRKEIAAAIAPANYLNQPLTVVEQVLTGTYADGLGNVVRDPARASFDPFPWEGFGIWILTQMKRWGQVAGDLDYAAIARNVLLATEARRAMQDLGLAPPAAARPIVVMGKPFDPAAPEAYLRSFPIGRG
jgi:nitrate/nitrite transport system substrate-binding protein